MKRRFVLAGAFGAALMIAAPAFANPLGPPGGKVTGSVGNVPEAKDIPPGIQGNQQTKGLCSDVVNGHGQGRSKDGNPAHECNTTSSSTSSTSTTSTTSTTEQQKPPVVTTQHPPTVLGSSVVNNTTTGSASPGASSPAPTGPAPTGTAVVPENTSSGGLPFTG